MRVMRAVLLVVMLSTPLACNSNTDTSPTENESSGSAQKSGRDPVTTRQGEGSGEKVTQLQGDAESAAEQVASGDGLRVVNKTGGPVALIHPDGATSWVAAGKSVVILRSCRDTLPLRAENNSGELIAERNGPCRQRDIWVLTR